MNWKSWIHVAERLAPVVLATVPGIPPRLVAPITTAITEAQQLELPGADKKAHVLAAAAALGATQDELGAIDNGIDTTVDVIKTFHDTHGAAIAAASAA